MWLVFKGGGGGLVGFTPRKFKLKLGVGQFLLDTNIFARMQGNILKKLNASSLDWNMGKNSMTPDLLKWNKYDRNILFCHTTGEPNGRPSL